MMQVDLCKGNFDPDGGQNPEEVSPVAARAYIASYWSIVLRDLTVCIITSYHCMRVNRRERLRLQAL